MSAQRPVLQKNKFAIIASLVILSGGMVGCSSGGGGQPKAAYTISVNGGSGGDSSPAAGGTGGVLTVTNNGTTAGVEVLNRDVANASFKLPISVPRADLGTNPLNISVNTTIEAVDFNNPIADKNNTNPGQLYLGTDNLLRTAAGNSASYATDLVLPAGTPYVRINDTGHVGVYDARGGDATKDTRFTGLSVASGVTLTLSENMSTGSNISTFAGSFSTNGSIVSFQNDIQNDGAIQGAAVNADKNLYLVANNYYGNGSINAAGLIVNNMLTRPSGSVNIYVATGIANNGSIDTSGFSSSISSLVTGGSAGDVTLAAGGYIINHGAINAAGGDGYDVGGAGGTVSMTAVYTENDATIDTSGGGYTDPVSSTTTSGGNAGNANILSNLVANNAGDITATGGDGTTGGAGGNVTINNQASYNPAYIGKGETINSGKIDVDGGMNTGTAASGVGGDAGALVFKAYGGSLINSGDLSANGGSASEKTANGGKAGSIRFDAYDTTTADLGDLIVSGNLSANGGNAAAVAGATGNGASGGSIILTNHIHYTNYSDQRVALLGYQSIDANGGDGNAAGNAASVGYVSQATQNASGLNTSGPIESEVPINAYGGNSTSSVAPFGHGGSGGAVVMSASMDPSMSASTNKITVNNIADINVNGGTAHDDAGATGTANAGSAGSVVFNAYHGIDNSGKLSELGGTGASVGGDGGYTGFTSVLSVINTGDIQANAGDGSAQGGNAAVFTSKHALDMIASKITNKGNITINGGNGTDATSSIGGNGGLIYIVGSGPGAATNTGAISYAAGTGATQAGLEGSATVDTNCTGNCVP